MSHGVCGADHKIAAYDKPGNLKVTVTKTGNKQLLAGDSMLL